MELRLAESSGNSGPEDVDEPRARVLIVGLRAFIFVSPLVAAAVLNRGVLDVPFTWLRDQGVMPWLVVAAASTVSFSGAYASSRRHSPPTLSTSLTLVCILIYLVGLAAALDLGEEGFRVATYATWWAIPIGAALWFRTLVLIADETIGGGSADPEGAAWVERTLRAWACRPSFFGLRFPDGFVVVASVAVAAASSAPAAFYVITGRSDEWGERTYRLTTLAEVIAGMGVATSFLAAALLGLAWIAQPTGLTIARAKRVRLGAYAAWTLSFVALASFFAHAIWPAPIVVFVLAVYTFAFAVAMVHAGASDERVVLRTSLPRRVISGGGCVVFAVTIAAVALKGHPFRATFLGAALGAAVPLAPVAFRALFGFERPPRRAPRSHPALDSNEFASEPVEESRSLEAPELGELEDENRAEALQALLRGRGSGASLSSAALNAARDFVSSLREREFSGPSGHDDYAAGKPTSDMRRIMLAVPAPGDRDVWRKRPATLERRLSDLIESSVVFTGTLDERLTAFLGLVYESTLAMEQDPKASPTSDLGRLRAYSVLRRIPAKSPGEQEAQNRLRWIYRAWKRGGLEWSELETKTSEELESIGRGANVEPEAERRRKQESKALNSAAYRVKDRWLSLLDRELRAKA